MHQGIGAHLGVCHIRLLATIERLMLCIYGRSRLVGKIPMRLAERKFLVESIV